MTAPASLSQHDLELISSFLDGSLTPKERHNFLSRLQQEPELRQALAEIRTVREGLRSLPLIRVPRAFRLTRDMVIPLRPSQSQRSRYYAWGSAVAAMALALLVFFDLSSSWGLAAQSIPAALPAALRTQATPNSPARAAAPFPISSPPAAESFSSPPLASQPTQVQALSAAVPTPAPLFGGAAPASATNELSSSIPQPPAAHTESENLPSQLRPSASPPWASLASTSRPLLRPGELLLALATAGLAIAALVSRRPRK